MIQVSAALRAALDSAANQPVDLYELYLDSGTLYYADQQIDWGGHTYLAKVKSRSAIKRHDGGEFDRVTVTFANVDRALAQTVLENEIEGRRLIVRKIDRTVAGDSVVLFVGEMQRPSRIDEETCTIEARQIIGSVEHDAPSRLFSPTCPFEPGEWECGEQLAGVPCDKSWSRCVELGNSVRYGGFRFVPHSGTFQYQEVESKRTWYTLGLWKRKKTRTVTTSFSAVDDTPYDVPIPIVYGRVQITGIDIAHADEGGVTKVLSAFCVGKIANIFHLRANERAVSDYTLHYGDLGALNSIDPRFPASYPYSLVAYAGVTIPSDVRQVDPAPQITGIVQGKGVSIFGPAGEFLRWEWSDNPIWCVRDFMSIPTAQGGMGVPFDWFDDAQLYLEAQYCDELVTNSTNDQKIYNPPAVPAAVAYKRYRSSGVDGVPVDVDGPYDDYEPGVDDDTSRTPAPVSVKRFTMNVAVAKQEKAIDILVKKLLPSFRGYITFSKEGKIQIRVERPAPNASITQFRAAGMTEILCAPPAGLAAGDVVLLSPFTASAETRTVAQVLADRIDLTAATAYAHSAGEQVLKVAMAFDDSNIVGGFSYPLSDRQPSVNRVTVKYVDAPAGFEPRELRINDYEHQAHVHKVNNEELDGSAIDSYFQAWRVGQWRRAKARDLGRFCELRADIKATLLEIGDVVAVSAAEVGLQAVPFRVIELSFEENDEATITAQLYSTGVYDDTAPQTTVTVPTIFGEIVPPGLVDPGPAPNVAATTTAALWYKYINGQGWVFGFEGNVVAPADVTNFSGCEIYLRWVGDSTYVGLAHSGKTGGAWRTNEPGLPIRTQDVDVVFVSKNRLGVENTDKSVCYTVRLSVTAALGNQLPNKPVGSTAQVNYTYVPGEGWHFGFSGKVVDPVDRTNYKGTYVCINWNGEDGVYSEVWNSGVSGLDWKSYTWPVSTRVGQSLRIVFVPTNLLGQGLPFDQCDYVSLTVTEQTVQTPAKPVGSTAQVDYEYVPEQGWQFGFSGAIADPADTSNYRGTKVFIQWDGETVRTEVWDSSLAGMGQEWQTYRWPVSTRAGQNLKIIFVPVNKLGQGLDWAQCDFVYLAISTQPGENAPSPDAASAATVGYVQRDGQWYFYFSGSVVHPSDTSNYASTRLWFQWEDHAEPQRLSEAPLGQSGWRTDEYKLPDEWVRWVDVHFVPVNRLGEEKTPYSSCFTIRLTVSSGAGVGRVNSVPAGQIPVGPGVVVDGGQVRIGTQTLDNMLLNPGFEFDLKDWNTSGASVIRDGTSMSGAAFARLVDSAWLDSPVPVRAGDVVTGDAWIRSATGGNIFLRLDCKDKAGGSTTTVFSPSATAVTAAWTRVSATVTIPANTVEVRFAIRQYSGTWDVDNCRMVRVPPTNGQMLYDDAGNLQLSTSTPDNLLFNPDFEFGFQAWGGYIGASFGFPLTAANGFEISSPAYTGSKCVKFTAVNVGIYQRYFHVRPGDVLIADLWVKADAGTAGNLELHVWGYDAAGNVNWFLATAIAVVTSWTKKSFSFAIPANSPYTRISFLVLTRQTAGAWYIDNCMLRRGLPVDVADLVEYDSEGRLKIKSVPDTKLTTVSASRLWGNTVVGQFVYAGTVNTNQVNSGTFTGQRMDLDESGVTMYFGAQWDTQYGAYSGVSVSMQGSAQRAFLSAGGVAGINSENVIGWEAYVNRTYSTLDGISQYYNWGFASLRSGPGPSIVLHGLKSEVSCCVLKLNCGRWAMADTIQAYLWVDTQFRLRAGRVAPVGNPNSQLDTVNTAGTVIAQL